MGSPIDKRILLLNEFIYANEGKPREIAQVVDVAQIIVKDYTHNQIMSDYVMYWTIMDDFLNQIGKDYLKPKCVTTYIHAVAECLSAGGGSGSDPCDNGVPCKWTLLARC